MCAAGSQFSYIVKGFQHTAFAMPSLSILFTLPNLPAGISGLRSMSGIEMQQASFYIARLSVSTGQARFQFPQT